MNLYSLAFSETFIQPVLDNGVSKVVQFSFPQGKVLEKHKTSSDILVFVLKGKIRFTAGEAVEIQAGQMLSLDKNIEHGIEALEESVVTLVLTPSPSAHTIFKPNLQNIAGDPHHGMVDGSGKDLISPQLRSFVEEHEELLAVLDKALGDFNEEAYFAAEKMVADELNQHFRYEEQYLFPSLGKYIGTTVGPIAVMLAEHKMIRERHADFSQQLSAWKSGQADEGKVAKSFAELENLLRTHVNKEDNVLFPMASRAMSEEDKDEVARQVSLEKEKAN